MTRILPLNKALRILLGTNAIILIASYMFGPIYALFVEKVGGDLLDASIAGGIYALAAALTTMLMGRFTDRIKEQELVVVLGYSILALAYLGFFFVDSTVKLLVVQAAIGFGEAIYSPAFDAVYSKHLATKRAGSQWGAWESMNYFTAASGSVIGGYIASVWGFPALFIVMSVLCAVSGLYIYTLPRREL